VQTYVLNATERHKLISARGLSAKMSTRGNRTHLHTNQRL